MEENRFIDKPLKLRISTEMHNRLKKIARENSQPMSAQIRIYIAEGIRRDEEKVFPEGGQEITFKEQISSQQSSGEDNRFRRGEKETS